MEKQYSCPICHFVYRDEIYAKKCEAWCKKHNSCNIEITQNAIGKTKVRE